MAISYFYFITILNENLTCKYTFQVTGNYIILKWDY